MNKVLEYSKYLAAISTIVGIAYGAFQFQHNYVKTTAETVVAPVTKKLSNLERRLTKNELNDLLKEALEELYYWRGMSRKYPDDQEVKDKLREAEENVEDIKERIQNLEEEQDESGQ